MSDFATARGHLERAYDCLQGGDEVSLRSREALDLLIEAVASAEFRRPTALIIPHPRMRAYFGRLFARHGRELP